MPTWCAVIERTVSWIAWLAVVLWITGVLPLLGDKMEVSWKVGNTHPSLVQSRWKARSPPAWCWWWPVDFRRRSRRQLLKGSGDDLSIRKIAANLRARCCCSSACCTLSAMGIDLTALSVLGGRSAWAWSFGLQKIAANHVSGLSSSWPSARCASATWCARRQLPTAASSTSARATIVIRALSGREAIVPNEMLITQRVENLSLADVKVLLSTGVQVA